MKDLHIAMSGDAALLTLVENFTKNWSTAKFANMAALDSEIKTILFKWVGVDTVVAGSRGTYVDAQAISFMEKLTGQYWGGGTTPRNPTAINQGAETNQAFEIAFSALKAQLIVQAGASSLFENPPVYNFVEGNLTEGVLSASGIAALAAQAPASNATTALKQSYWKYIANFLLSTKDYADFTAAEKASLTNAIGASINGMTFDGLVVSIPVYAANFISTEFSDFIVGARGSDILSGKGGDDILKGLGGNDSLNGGTGNDTYIYSRGEGFDFLSDTSGNDTLAMQGNITLSDISFQRFDANDLYVYLNGEQIILIFENYKTSTSVLENITFANGTSFNLSEVGRVVGDSMANTLNGIDHALMKDDSLFGNDGNDILDGRQGNDYLFGGTGDDTYIYNVNSGLDIIKDDSGRDTISFGSGIIAANINWERTGTYDLLIKSGSTDIILIQNYYLDNGSIETLKFSNGSTINLSAHYYTLNGTAGNDNLQSLAIGGNDIIFGLEGDDRINARAGDDIVYGGLGNDQIYTDFGNDTIVYEGGVDEYYDFGGTDVIKITDATINVSNITFRKTTQYDVEVLLKGQSAFIIKGQFWQQNGYERIEFANGAFLDLGTVSYQLTATTGNDNLYGIGFGGNPNDIISGLAGNDIIYGYEGNDTLDGGSGNDTIDGGLGDDTYKYNLNEGLDKITDQGGNDTIILGSGLAQQDITYVISGKNLLILHKGVQILELVNHLNTGYGIETIRFANGTEFKLSDIVVTLMGTASADNLLGQSLSETILGLAGNDMIAGGLGDDILTGGIGRDTLDGETGNDTYVFSVGDSLISAPDLINYNQGEGVDTIRLTGGILPQNVTVWKEQGIFGLLNIQYSPTDKIQIQGWEWVTSTSKQGKEVFVEKIAFDNGTILNIADLLNPPPVQGYNPTAGNDSINASAATSGVTIDLLAGNDTFTGSAYNDTITGGAGTDTLNGGAGNDIYNFSNNTGPDTITDGSGIDRIVLGNGITSSNVSYLKIGNDLSILLLGTEVIKIIGHYAGTGAIETLQFADGTTVNLTTLIMPMNGTTGNDTLNGTSGDDVINGLTGNDTLNGNGGNDTFDGGAGTDAINGGAGNDTYNIASGSGLDTITDTSGTDRIVFGTGILQANTTYLRSGNDLTILVSGTQIALIVGHYAGTGAVEALQFSNGTTVNLTTLNLPINGTTGNDTLNGTTGNEVINGFAGNDVLNGNGGNDTFDGGAGTDAINGGAGNDTYNIASGSGIDTIADTAGTDKIVFGSGLVRTNMSLIRDTANINDLAISFSGTRVALVKNFFTGTNQVETLQFSDGSTYNLLTHSFLLSGTIAADTLTGYNGVDTIRGGAGNDTLYGGGGNDFLYGETGNDTLRGEAGNDIYVFDGGLDRVYETGGTDTLQLGAGMTVDALVFSDVGTIDTKMAFSAGVNEFTVYGLRSTDTNLRVENVTFLDGFSATLSNYKSWVWGTTAAQTTAGTANADTILGRGGNDTINGNAGNDGLHGGAGNDTVRGGDGNDLVRGGIGNDTLYGDAGNDVLYGDDGLDNLYGGTGADAFKFLKETAFKNIDVINDFSTSQGDKIDIAGLLQGYDPVTKAITDFVQITTSGANSILRVDVDGGANSFVQIATINGITGLTDEAALVASGNLVAT